MMDTLVYILKRVALMLFVVLVVMASYNNHLRTELAVLKVEEFFIRARTIQTAQTAADRAMALVEVQTFAYEDLRKGLDVFVKKYQRLSFQADDAMIKAAFYEQVIHSQNKYIVELQDMLKDNKLPVPAQPRINLEPQVCPTPKRAGNSFNLQRPTSPMPNALPRSPGGSSPRSSTELDASGTEVYPEA
jgi:hypothetical protein